LRPIAAPGRLRLAALTATAALAVLVMWVVKAPTSTRATTVGRPTPEAVVMLPEPVAPAFTLELPRGPVDKRAPRARFNHYWAPVMRPVNGRLAPDRGAAVVGRLELTTPEGTSNLVPVLGRVADRTGQLWVRVRLPVLPNNTVAWVPRSSLGGYGVVRTRLVVDRQRLEAILFRAGRVVFRAPVGVGRPSWPTPKGHFYIRNRLMDFVSATYGPLAFGTSARSAVLTDWPAGGYIGIHGTDRPDLLPGRVSHGCIRMRNEDILRLGALMPVGTPLEVR
jgi:lipoprotein-anchoring transpeptidase ErfK/SrfK